MGTFKIHKSDNFTIINNSVFRDKSLSWKAKGILTQMLSLPEEWDYTEAGLSKLATDGITSTKSALKELEKAGYLVRTFTRKNGRITDINYDIYESPLMAKEASESTEEPDGNPNATDKEVTSSDKQNADNKEEMPGIQAKQAEPMADEPSSGNPLTGQPLLGNPLTAEPLLGFPLTEKPLSVFKHNKELIDKELINKELSSTIADNPTVAEPAKDDFYKWMDDISANVIKSSFIDEVLKIAEAIYNSKQPTTISGKQLAPEEVRKKITAIKAQDIIQVANILEQNAQTIFNKTAYIKTLLMNPPQTTGPVNCAKPAFNDFEQRTYDFNKLEQILTGINR